MPAYMVKVKIDDDMVQYKAVVAQNESQAEQFARQQNPGANSVTVGKQLTASEIQNLGLDGKPDGHIQPWAPVDG